MAKPKFECGFWGRDFLVALPLPFNEFSSKNYLYIVEITDFSKTGSPKMAETRNIIATGFHGIF